MNEQLRFESARGKWVLLATVGGSGITLLDSTIVNVALPHIGKNLHADVAGLQWIINGYLLTLASLILLGGSLSDLFGRRKLFIIGTAWFAGASLLCGLAPSLPWLVTARIFQGIGGALLTPCSLAIIESSFHPDDRARAIGAWTGFGGIAAAIGPLAGGFLVTHFSWRWIFLVNLPFAAAVIWVAIRFVPESRDDEANNRLDYVGAALGAITLGALTYVLIESPVRGFFSDSIAPFAILGIVSLIAFIVFEQRTTYPMLPLKLFRSQQFTGANLVTVVMYAALNGMVFLLAVQFQQVLLYSPIKAGISLVPITIVMLLFGARGGALATRIGPRIPMTVGPFLCGSGFLILSRMDEHTHYFPHILLGVLVFASGLALTVAPLTATVLSAAPNHLVGVASGVNNAIARAGGLIGVAALPVLGGITGEVYQNRAQLAHHFPHSAVWAAGFLYLASALAFATIRKPIVGREAEVTSV